MFCYSKKILIFFVKIDTIVIVVNFTILNFINSYNNRKLKMTPLLENSITSSFTVAYAVSPSLGNFLSSLIAGALVLAAIGGALAFISNSDRVQRS